LQKKIQNDLQEEFKKMSQFSNEQHISQQDLLRYVEDDCSRTEMRAIDRHLATCPMCSDAVEGLMLLSDPSVAVAQLDKKIDEKVAEKIVEKPIGTPVEQPVEKPIFEVVKRPFWQQRWAAAAAVLLMASGSIWVYKNTQKAEKQAVASAEIQAAPSSELENSAASAVSVYTDTLAQTPQYAAAQTVKKTTNPAQSTPSGSPTSTSSSQDIAQNAPQSRGVEPVLAEKAARDAKNRKAETRSKPTAEIVEVAPAAYKTGKPRISADTISIYTPTDRNRDFAEASAQKSMPRPTEQEASKLKDVESVKSEEKKQVNTDRYKEDVVVQAEKKRGIDMPAKKTVPMSAPAPKTNGSVTSPATTTTSGSTTGGYASPTTDYDQVFNRAESYFRQKNYEEAAKEYAHFLNLDTSGNRPEHALFQLANCYLKLNKKADAKVLFEKLSAANGQYQRAAKKALKDL
jgi:TolA-binding protein/anti-sigma factor RsiW